MYEPNPKFFNQDGSINFETACAAGRRERSVSAYKAIRSVWQKITKTASASKQKINTITETRSTDPLKTS